MSSPALSPVFSPHLVRTTKSTDDQLHVTFRRALMFYFASRYTEKIPVPVPPERARVLATVFKADPAADAPEFDRRSTQSETKSLTIILDHLFPTSRQSTDLFGMTLCTMSLIAIL